MKEKCFNCGRAEDERFLPTGRGKTMRVSFPGAHSVTRLTEAEIGGRFVYCCQQSECRRVLHDEQDGANES